MTFVSLNSTHFVFLEVYCHEIIAFSLIRGLIEELNFGISVIFLLRAGSLLMHLFICRIPIEFAANSWNRGPLFEALMVELLV